MLVQLTFERLQYYVQNSIWIQVEIANHRLDNFEGICWAGQRQILIELSYQFSIAFVFFAK